MGSLVRGFVLFLQVKSYVFIRVFTTPKMDSNEALTNDFSKFVNVSNPVLTNISSCLWTSISFEGLGRVWTSDNRKYFRNNMVSDRNMFVIVGLWTIVEFPRDFFVPDKWVFFCCQAQPQLNSTQLNSTSTSTLRLTDWLTLTGSLSHS